MNYVLPIIGIIFVAVGLNDTQQATTIMHQILGELAVGFGVLIIGIGALIGVIKNGFARLEKRLTPAPVPTVSATAPDKERLSAAPTLPPEQPSLPPKGPKEFFWIGLERCGLGRQ